MKALKALLDVLSSLWLTTVLLVLLGLLTWLGTLEQVELGLFEVQKRYFESWFVIARLGALRLPLPGGGLVLGVLFVNLVLGGLVRMRWSRQTAGILVVHVGILLLLLAGFVEFALKKDGHVTLFEGQRASYFQSYHAWELAVLEDLGEGRAREQIVDQASFPEEGRVPVRLDGLPFFLELGPLIENCRPIPAGPHSGSALPAVDGFALLEEPRDPENERNLAGCYLTVASPQGSRREAILWGVGSQPYAFAIGERRFALELRRQRFPMAFTLSLVDFRKEDHPGITMPKSFESDVNVIEGDNVRPVRISMNEPLRHHGLVLYQSSWGPANARPGDPLFSTFSVARNPTDRWPLAACIVIALGLVMHFARKLARTLRAEARPA